MLSIKNLYHSQYSSLFCSNRAVRLAAISSLIPDPSSDRKLFLPSFNLLGVIIPYPRFVAFEVFTLEYYQLYWQSLKTKSPIGALSVDDLF